MSRPARLAVFASGGGTNLQALLDYFNDAANPHGRVKLVVSNRREAGALGRAETAGIPTSIIDPITLGPAAGPETLAVLRSHEIGFIALAGYLKPVPDEVVEEYRGRIVNIHPALLPAFGGAGMYGLRVHRAVLESGARVSGASVHLVDERYDEGKIIAQWPVPVLTGDTPEQLAARVLRVEHLLYPRTVEALIRAHGGGASTEDLAFDLIHAASPDPLSMQRLIGQRSSHERT